jgi:hypothetical protein
MLAGAAVLPAAYFCYAIFGQAGVLMSMNFILVAMAIACLLTGNRAQSLRAGTAT